MAASGELSYASGSSELSGSSGFVSSSFCNFRIGMELVTVRVRFSPLA